MLAALSTIRRCQPDAASAFIDLKAQAALFVIVGLLAQLRELDGIGQQPILQVDIVGVDLCGGVFGIVIYLILLAHRTTTFPSGII